VPVFNEMFMSYLSLILVYTHDKIFAPTSIHVKIFRYLSLKRLYLLYCFWVELWQFLITQADCALEISCEFSTLLCSIPNLSGDLIIRLFQVKKKIGKVKFFPKI
jgi:hypothetical protein